MGKVLSICFRNKRHEYDDLRQEFDATDYDVPLDVTPYSDRDSTANSKSKEVNKKEETIHVDDVIVSEASSTVRQQPSKPTDVVKPSVESGSTDFPFLQDSFTVRYIQGPDTRTMFIMRGLPGSGKSTLVQEIVKKYPSSVVCSADSYFMKDGEYRYNRDELKTAHQMSQSKADDACRQGERIIIIDNTNIKRWEFKPYIDIARRSGYTYVLVTPKTSWKNDAAELAKRNHHNVDLETVQQKLRSYEEYVPFYYGWFLNPTESKKLVELSKKCLLSCVRKNTQLLLNLFGDTAAHEDGEILEYFQLNKEGNKILHCTSKFLGPAKNPQPKRLEYHESPDVQNAVGKAFTLELTGLVLSSEVVGFRVKLPTDSLKLYDKPEEKEADRLFLQKKHLDEQISILDDVDLPTHPDMPPRGRSAHLTVATAKGIPPKRTTDVLLEVCEVEHSQEMHGKTTPGVKIEGGTSRQLRDQYWTITFDKPVVVSTLFSGF